MRNVRVTVMSENHLIYNGTDSMATCLSKASDFIENQIRIAFTERPDLIVLAEVYDNFMGMPQEKVNELNLFKGNKIYDMVKELAAEGKTNIVFNSQMDGGDGYLRNRSMFIGRDGQEKGIYDKNHLVWEEHTRSNVAFGDDPQLIEMDIGKLGGVICYDLNFDELREKYVKLKPEILCFSSMFHGGYMARHWASTNRCFFVGAVAHRKSFIINPLGEVVAETHPYIPYVSADINLDYVVAHLDYNWPKKVDIKRKYGNLVDIQTPHGLGRFIITSKHPEKSALEIAKEFEIELLDDLLARGRKQREDFLNSRKK